MDAPRAIEVDLGNSRTAEFVATSRIQSLAGCSFSPFQVVLEVQTVSNMWNFDAIG